MQSRGDEKMAQRLQELATLLEDPGWILAAT